MLSAFLLHIVSTYGVDPAYAANITVYHVNEHSFGAVPVNMNTADAIGDLFFDMIEVLPYPIACPNGTNTSHNSKYGPNPCTNPEAGGPELMVNKLTLEVDTRFSGYAACNVGINNTDPFGGPCKTGTYCCDCTGGSYPPQKVPCNDTLGYENVFEQFGKWMGKGCKRTIFEPHPTAMDCYRGNLFSKLSAENHGSWYSSLAKGHCGGVGAEACAWRVVSVDKIVERSCHVRVFGATVAATAPGCFDDCGSQKTNTSSPCWVNCLYKAALGPDAGTPGGAVAGMSTTDLIAAWTKPFLPEAEGGCPPQEAWVEAV